jgi:hypothetical protein
MRNKAIYSLVLNNLQMKKIIYFASFLACVSCQKIAIEPNEQTNAIEVNTMPNSIQGNWYPIDQCRIDLKESFNITDSTFTWNFGIFKTIYLPIDSLHNTTFASGENYNYYKIANDSIYFYSRIGIGGEPITNNGYILKNSFFLKANNTNLFFANFTYKR